VAADNRQLSWDTRCRKGCFHQNSVYQLHAWAGAGVMFPA
jgi:hypothetical protein